MDLLGETGQESAIKTNVSKNVLFQKEVQLYFDHIALGKVEAGGRKKRTHRNFQ